ncbi:Glycosyl hydrolases family 16 [Geosmithia morbida]|uniref:Glycosyl hydrolases family 16 n=1 Tax=Geosmithia morbida TaxID=1094350 RepID=A0A9P5D6V3_9HYPO|nr:Glycosyl hydrolases family 16 [Geosmithia morbida]KAF4125971.1 Glycosyl hydrolases family 16 [Geosmithia morbida]
MRASTFYSAVLAAAPVALAVRPPTIQGMNLTWSDSFNGDAGSGVNTKAWSYVTVMSVNDELQTYSDSSSNVQLSGGETLQIVPWKKDDGSWTSGRLEAVDSFTPAPGKKMRWQAGLRMGDGSARQGMWPAFWLLGDAVRSGTEWPLCGELDIFEQVNGVMTGYGSVHCGSDSWFCTQPDGVQQPVAIPNNDWHQWALEVDRSSGYWMTESITWYLDGNPYQTILGAEVADEGTWGTLAHSPYYMILNVAVGGTWPGDPDASTQSGYENMMEVLYTAVYEST